MVSKKGRGAKGASKRGVKREAAGATEAGDAARGAAGDEIPTDLYSLRQLASILKVDRNGLAEKVRGLDSFPGTRGSRLYSLEAVEEALAAEADPELAEARRRKLLAEAQLAELKLRRERGEVGPVRDFVTHAINIFRAWRMRLAVTMPREISEQLYRAESPAHVAEVLRVEVDRMLNEFRTDHLRFVAETEGFEGGIIVDEEA